MIAPQPLQSARYWYDGDGRMVKGDVNGVITYYPGRHYNRIVDGETSTVKKYYTAGTQTIAARTIASGNSTLNWILADHLGSTSMTTDENGIFNSEIQYSAFGEVWAASGVTPTGYKYTGQLEQVELGLDYFVARWYDPYLNHFIQADTVIPSAGNAKAYDRYGYARNNPIKFNDPSGHDVGRGRDPVLRDEDDKKYGSYRPWFWARYPLSSKATITPTLIPTLGPTLIPTTTDGYNPEVAINHARATQPSLAAKSGDNCTEFVSESLSAGGIPTTDTWNPGQTSWVNTPALYQYLTGSLGYKNIPYQHVDIQTNTGRGPLRGNSFWEDFLASLSAEGVQGGDLVFYLDPTHFSGGYSHVAMITGWGGETNNVLTSFSYNTNVIKPLVIDVSGPTEDINLLPRSIDDTDNLNIRAITIVLIGANR